MIILAFAESAIQLVPDGTLFLHLLMILIMVGVLNRTLFRPVNKVLADREEQTTGRLTEAKNLRAQLENGLQRYERGLRDARSAAYQFVELERTDALREREERLNQVREEVRSWISEEKSELDRQTEAARKSLSLESRESGIQISSQILHRPVSNSYSGGDS
jgi:F-type H+-transporting ATPase subunit b